MRICLVACVLSGLLLFGTALGSLYGERRRDWRERLLLAGELLLSLRERFYLRYFPSWAGQGRLQKEGKWLGGALWCFWGLCFLGALAETGSGRSISTVLLRGEAGEGAVEYVWTVTEPGGEEVQVELSVASLWYDEEERESLFAAAQEELYAALFAEGEDADAVRSDLTFLSTAQEGLVSVSWRVGDSSLLRYDGSLRTAAIAQEGSLTYVTATLIYESFSEEVTWQLCLYPPLLSEEESWALSLEAYLQELEEENREEELFLLPEEYEGSELVFYQEEETVNGAGVLFLAICLAGLWIAVKARQEKEEKQRRLSQMEADYPEIVMKETVLLGAGMTVFGAFERIVRQYRRTREERGRRYAYEELLITWNQIQSGVAEGEAYLALGRRSGLHCYMKLGSLLSQSVKTGSRGLILQLEEEVRAASEDKKTRARRRGEEAGTRLLLPMFLMLLVIVLLVMIPALWEMEL